MLNLLSKIYYYVFLEKGKLPVVKTSPHKSLHTNLSIFHTEKAETCQLGILIKNVELNQVIYKNVFCVNSVIFCDQLYSKVIQQGLAFCKHILSGINYITFLF